jgi:hypothetical protein
LTKKVFAQSNDFTSSETLRKVFAKVLQNNIHLAVLSPGVEPGAPVPQTEILSIKLREQVKNKNESSFLFFPNAARERNLQNFLW